MLFVADIFEIECRGLKMGAIERMKELQMKVRGGAASLSTSLQRASAIAYVILLWSRARLESLFSGRSSAIIRLVVGVVAHEFHVAQLCGAEY